MTFPNRNSNCNVNYFGSHYPQPQDEHPFSVGLEFAESPWHPDKQLLRNALNGRALDIASRPDCNLVFLLDVSGSMMQPSKVPLVRASFSDAMLEQIADRGNGTYGPYGTRVVALSSAILLGKLVC